DVAGLAWRCPTGPPSLLQSDAGARSGRRTLVLPLSPPRAPLDGILAGRRREHTTGQPRSRGCDGCPDSGLHVGYAARLSATDLPTQAPRGWDILARVRYNCTRARAGTYVRQERGPR